MAISGCSRDVTTTHVTRLLQAAAVLLWFLIPISCIAASFLLLWQASGIAFWAFIAYLAYIVLFQTYHNDGGVLRTEWVRRWRLWKYFADYFPVNLIKTKELPPHGRYIFVFHPHGILGFGAVTCFATEGTQWSEVFPGIRPHLVTLQANFRVPFYSLFISALGICSANRTSLKNIMNRRVGNAVCLVVGGAPESLYAHPGTYEIVLSRRLGFIKHALEIGCSLVPTFSFGENDLYLQMNNPPESFLRKIQDFLEIYLKFATPIVWFMPRRRKVNVVVGEPLLIPKVPSDQITQQIVNDYHAKYVASLRKLFEDNWKEYDPSNANGKLTIH